MSGIAPSTAAPPRHPRFVRITHWLTTIAVFALLVSGVELILSHPRFYWGEVGNVNTAPIFSIPVPSSRSTVPTGYGFVLPDQNGWSRYLHFQAAWLVLFTGLVYLIYGARTGHFGRELVPAPADRSWRALRTTIAEHVRFTAAALGDPGSYNGLQRLSYLVVVFVLFPLVIWTGLAMAPGFTAVLPSTVNVLGGRQSARTLHFLITVALVLFTLVHVTMIIVAGFRSRVGAMIPGNRGGPPSINQRRRAFVTGGIVAAGAVAGAALAGAGRRFGLVPPDCGGFYGPGETLAYASHRLFGRNALAREFPRSMISTKPFANSISPPTDAFKHHQAADFATWQLKVEGLVDRPTAWSLAELRAMGVQSQITEVTCEEGWSYVAEWTGTPLSMVLNAAGVRSTARYVVYYSSDPDWWESIDIDEALHPQTLLAWGMNGAELPVPFGGPLRLRVPRQLGYKSVKFVDRLVITDSLDGFGSGTGQSAVNDGYSWYAGI